MAKMKMTPAEIRWFTIRLILLAGDRPDVQEIAALLRSGEPIPEYARDLLADMLDPPSSDRAYEYKLVLEPNKRAKQRLERYLDRIALAAEISHAMETGMSKAEATAKLAPDRQKHVDRAMKDLEEFCERGPAGLRQNISSILKWP